MLFLQQFDLQIVYRPGKQHSNADALSRPPLEDSPVAAIQVDEPLAITSQVQDQDHLLAKVVELLTAGQPLQLGICHSPRPQKIISQGGYFV